MASIDNLLASALGSETEYRGEFEESFDYREEERVGTFHVGSLGRSCKAGRCRAVTRAVTGWRSKKGGPVAARFGVGGRQHSHSVYICCSRGVESKCRYFWSFCLKINKMKRFENFNAN